MIEAAEIIKTLVITKDSTRELQYKLLKRATVFTKEMLPFQQKRVETWPSFMANKCSDVFTGAEERVLPRGGPILIKKYFANFSKNKN